MDNLLPTYLRYGEEEKGNSVWSERVDEGASDDGNDDGAHAHEKVEDTVHRWQVIAAHQVLDVDGKFSFW